MNSLLPNKSVERTRVGKCQAHTTARAALSSTVRCREMSPQVRAYTFGSLAVVVGSAVALALLFAAAYKGAGRAYVVAGFAGPLITAVMARSHRFFVATGVFAVVFITLFLSTVIWHSYDPIEGNGGLDSAASLTLSFARFLVVVSLLGAALGWVIIRFRNATPNKSLEPTREG